MKSPLSPDNGEDIRTQFGALCWRPIRRRNGEDIEVLLITSRDTGRWIIPKGWPIAGLTPEGAAAREAWEEAGVRGAVNADQVGLFTYDKLMSGNEDPVPCAVTVFELHVDDLADRFPECKQRRRKWFSPKKAARKVAEPELRALLLDFDSQRATLNTEGRAADA